MPSRTHYATLFGLLVQHRTIRSAFASLQKLGRYVVFTRETAQGNSHLACNVLGDSSLSRDIVQLPDGVV